MADDLPTCEERICDSILDTIGGTPLVRLSRVAVAEEVPAEILAKLEFFNPLGSVKDRIGLAMIEDLECSGCLAENTVLVEPISGNCAGVCRRGEWVPADIDHAGIDVD